jgi:putative endonuclease
MAGEGSNYTRKRLPVTLVYIEEFTRVDDAFNREHQIKRWTRAKKAALIHQHPETLPRLAQCQNLSHYAFQELRDDLRRLNEKKQSKSS